MGLLSQQYSEDHVIHALHSNPGLLHAKLQASVTVPRSQLHFFFSYYQLWGPNLVTSEKSNDVRTSYIKGSYCIIKPAIKFGCRFNIKLKLFYSRPCFPLNLSLSLFLPFPFSPFTFSLPLFFFHSGEAWFSLEEKFLLSLPSCLPV